jgi:hypothetical protein
MTGAIAIALDELVAPAARQRCLGKPVQAAADLPQWMLAGALSEIP